MWQDREMKATVDLPEELLERAKSVAERRGVTLGDLIGAALERDLEEGAERFPLARRLHFPLFESRAPGSLLLTHDEIARAEAEVGLHPETPTEAKRLAAIYTLLEAKFDSGEEQVAARHDEHQP